MKYIRYMLLFSLLFALLTGCGSSESAAEAEGDTLLATTYPMYNLLEQITNGPAGAVENLKVEIMVADEVSCLHDYTLTTAQMKLVEQADMIFLSGAGLEDFMGSALASVPAENIVDTSAGVPLIDGDPHIWLDPERYAQQVENAVAALSDRYPESADILRQNAKEYQESLLAFKTQWQETFASLGCREIITFHDGFTYLADAYDLTILAAIEEEEGAEASASAINEICQLIRDHGLTAVFYETSGSKNAATIVSQETGVATHPLDMLMSGKKAENRDEFLVGMMANNVILESALKEDDSQ